MTPKEQSDMPLIGCVGHDCAECRAREAQPQPTDPRIAALEAKCKDYEAALRDTMQSLGDTMQSLAWLSFGQARGYSDVLLTAQGAMDKGRAALAKHGGAA